MSEVRTMTAKESFQFFFAKGDMHDAHVEALVWKQAPAEFSIVVDDMNKGFLNLPEYEGHQRAELTFEGVDHIVIDDVRIEDSRPWIFDIAEEPGRDGLSCVRVGFSPGGKITLCFKSCRITYLDA